MSQLDKNRIATLDVMRGFAMLGILIMNIQSFSMPGAAYINPTAYGNFYGLNKVIWMFSHVFADLKFMTLFSILFGAGIILFCSNADNKGKNARWLHFKRMFGLLIFGLVHSYLFWYGDILFYYSICGFLAYFFRNKSIRYLSIGAIILMLIPTLYNLGMGMSLKYMPPEALQELSENWAPNAENIEKELAAYLGGFGSAFQFRVKTTVFMQTFLFLTVFLWRILGTMFIGMALFKSRFFHLEWTEGSYKRLVLISLPAGLVVTLLGLALLFKYSFSFEYGMFIGNQFNYLGSAFLALGYAAVVSLMVKSIKWPSFQNRLASIGKTAFSNYLLQTFICTTLFYGYGFGFFGQFERWQQACVVILVWIFQLWISPIWLAKFRSGPMEFLWRSFTYSKFQAMRRLS